MTEKRASQLKRGDKIRLKKGDKAERYWDAHLKGFFNSNDVYQTLTIVEPMSAALRGDSFRIKTDRGTSSGSYGVSSHGLFCIVFEEIFEEELFVL